jgi:hypothetical protein
LLKLVGSRCICRGGVLAGAVIRLLVASGNGADQKQRQQHRCSSIVEGHGQFSLVEIRSSCLELKKSDPLRRQGNFQVAHFIVAKAHLRQIARDDRAQLGIVGLGSGLHEGAEQTVLAASSWATNVVSV